MKKNLIITACNENHGDFLSNHWYPSLKENVNLRDIDVAVIDYGLNKKQLAKLKGVKVIKGAAKGHIVTARFKDISTFLKNSSYSQVLCCDGGDIIFQTDISEIFTISPNEIKATTEDIQALFKLLFIGSKNYENKNYAKRLKKVVLTTKTINVGFFLGPRKKIQRMLEECYNEIKKKNFGQDQTFYNYYLYTHGFFEIDNKYNYCVPLNEIKIKIKEGKVYFSNGELIPVVHNVSLKPFMLIQNFGYGKEFNKINSFHYLLIRLFRKKVHLFYLLLSKILVNFK